MESKDRALITGSSGRIGSALIHRLAARYEIIGLDDAGPPYPPRPAHCIPVDMESDNSVADALKHVRENYGSGIASVIHLAGHYSFTGDADPRYYTVNVLGTRRLLRGLQNFEVGQFVFASSMLVHAPQASGQRINEDSPLKPKWEYPKSKLETEEAVRRERGHIPAVILRIAGVYDDWCHLPKAVAKTGAWLQEVALPEEEEPFIKHWMIDIADDHYELDITRARSLLGWDPQRRLLGTLSLMVYFLKQDPLAWYKTNSLEAPADLQERAAPPKPDPACRPDDERPRS